MSFSVINMNSFLAGVESWRTKPEEAIRDKLKVALRLVHEGVTSRTPVHTGKSLRNWQWSMDRPASSNNLPALGSGDPGRTSQMSLGSEPRRPANQAAVDASFSTLDLSQPLRQYWMSNNSSEILDLEYGKLPSPSRSRSPGGMARVTFEELLQALR